MSIKVIKDPDAVEDLTPETLGRILAEMPSDHQARAFNALAEVAEGWPGNSQVQWVYVAEELTTSAADLLGDISEFCRMGRQ